MPLLDTIRETKLTELAKSHFDANPTPAELQVLHTSATSEDLPDPDINDPRPDIRSAFVRWLATDPEALAQIDPKGIRVYSATLAGSLDLEASRIPVRLDLRCCTVKGEVNLGQAETRDILFVNSTVEGGRNFHADTIVIHGLLHLRGSTFSGSIRLGGAKIEGDLDCSGATLELLALKAPRPAAQAGQPQQKPEIALFADGADIGGDAFLRDDFSSNGEIRIIGAKIKGDLSLSGAKLIAAVKEVKDVLSVDATEIGGSVWFSHDFEASSKIRLRGARIGGSLAFVAATVAEVDCNNLNLSGDLHWRRIAQSRTPHLDLRGATLKNMCDDEQSWPAKDHLFLNGLTYQELTLHAAQTPQQIQSGEPPQPLRLEAKEGTRKRIQWLLRQPGDQCIKPQPWIQLSKYLETRGQHSAAKHVIYEQKVQQAHDKWPGPWFFVRWLTIAFACLEEVPWRIAYSIAITLFLGTLIFSGAYRSGAMVRTDDKTPADRYPPFQPFVYALENVVPLAKLGMDDKYTPNPNPKRLAQMWFPQSRCLDWLRVFNTYWFLAVSRWLLIFLGWFQAGVLGAALMSRFKE
ncbi:MAG: hypothetical protein ABSB60_18360 [Terracidiphilus sp.]|jgi:hypothetical protein